MAGTPANILREVRARFERGETYGEIGAALSISRNAVAGICARNNLRRTKEQRAEREKRSVNDGMEVSFRLNEGLALALKNAARARDTNPTALLAKIARTVLREGLIGAVLDD